MKFIEQKELSSNFHEVQITIDDSEGYAEIIEVYRKYKDGPGFVIVTSVKSIEALPECDNQVDTDIRKFEQ